MASVPNTNIFPAVPQTGAPVPADGEGGEFFASLLTPAVGTIVEGPVVAAPLTAQLSAELTPTNGKGEEGETPDGDADGEADGDDAIATLFAQVDFVPVVQPQIPPAAAAALVTAPVPIAPDAEAPAVAPEGKSVPAPLPSPLPLPTPLPQPSTVVSLSAPPVPGHIGKYSPGPQADPVAEVAKAPDGPALEKVVEMAAKLIGEGKGKSDAAAKTARGASPGRAHNAAAQGPDAGPATRVAAPMPTETAAADTAPAEKTPGPAAAPAQPIATSPTVTAPIVAPAELLATVPTARAAPAQPQSVDQSIQQELDLAHEGEWLDRLARDIASAGAADGPMRFKLNPQTLGHMRVELTQTDQGTNIRLTVETEAARAILADAQPRLAVEARAQGVRLGHTEIDLSGNGHQAAGEQRRQEEGRQTNFIRTARGAEAEVVASVETARANRSDRYA